MTIVSALVFLIFRVSVDAYAGIIMSLVVLKAAFDVLRSTVSNLSVREPTRSWQPSSTLRYARTAWY